ncbi:MAG TPA: PAS domain S-box protein [Ktedonobacterales bacterium]
MPDQIHARTEKVHSSPDRAHQRPVGAPQCAGGQTSDEASAVDQPGEQAEIRSGTPIELPRGIVEMAPDAIVVVDNDGHIMLVNRQAEAHFGYTREELLGATIELLVPERFQDIHAQHRAHYNAAPRTRPMGIHLELYGRRKDGTEFPVEISLAHLPTSEGHLVIATVRDVTQRKLLEQALHIAEQQARAVAEAQLKRLQTILEELPSGICLVQGADARLALANRAMTDVWGAEWLVGQPILEFLVANGIQVLQLNGKPLPPHRLVALRATHDGEAVRQHQQIVRHPDGTTLPVVVNAVPLDPVLLGDLLPARQSREPEPVALIVYQDVSALKEAERVKDEFVALAAHELRNPMAALKGFATMLQQGGTRPENGYEAEVAELQADAVTEIQRATDRLVALTDDLLDVTRVQAGRLELHLEPHDLIALSRRVARRLAVTTDRHTIAVHAEADYLVANIDVRRMEQVVTNLLNNAIKYSPEGGAITFTLREDPPGSAEVCVSDPGIGIPQAEQGRVFARFARAANAQAHGIHGTGLGLYLCRELVERHGGQIWFESTEGQGSTFSFSLPLVVEDGEE